MRWIQAQIQSSTLKMPVGIDILLPETKKPLHAIYLLHDLTKNHTQWIRLGIESYFEQSNFALIMPQGNNSLFLNTKNNYPFFQFLTEELPQLCSSWFGIRNTQDSRFIAGLGLGGYTAVLAAFKAPNFYQKAIALDGKFDLSILYSEEYGNDASSWFGDQKTFQESTDHLWNPETVSSHSLSTDITLITNAQSIHYEESLRLSKHLVAFHPLKTHLELLDSKSMMSYALEKLVDTVTEEKEVELWQS